MKLLMKFILWKLLSLCLTLSSSAWKGTRTSLVQALAMFEAERVRAGVASVVLCGSMRDWLFNVIEAEEARGIPASRICIVGYSQGGALAAYSSIQFPRQLAGTLVLSG
jgi:hypothetical protein